MNFQEIWENLINQSKKITIQSILDNQNLSPKRICFKTSHKNSLRKINFEGNKAIGAFFLPFDESIDIFLENETQLKLIKTQKEKFWCPVNNDEDFEKLNVFFEKFNNIVFLRDNLDCSIAISEHMFDEENRTELGQLEFEAKYNNCRESTEKIADFIINFIESTNVYEDIDLICAIPSSKSGNINLPQKIVDLICKKIIHKQNISDLILWQKDKPQLKDVNLEEKLQILQETGLNINFDLKNKNIILMDDLYQSGFTMQFVAMKLKEAGAKKIYGISIVKSRRDTDNK